MKAVVLAGGFGTRLRPLSCTRSKPMFPIANKPILAWIIEGLAEAGVEEAILAVNYLANNIQSYFGSKFNGVRIKYAHESRPMGTGGPLWAARRWVKDGHSFLMLYGDIFSAFSYSELIDFHDRNGATATLALCEIEDVSMYGVAEMDSNGQVSRFLEKPEPWESKSRLINAGAFVLDPSVYKYLPGRGRFSMERQVFPRLASEGRLFGHVFKEPWTDVGRPADYLSANFLALERCKPVHGPSSRVDAGATIVEPVALGARVRVKRGSRIGPYVSIGDLVVVQEGGRIERSVVMPQAVIGEHSSIRGAIVGERASVGAWVKVEDGAIIGDHVQILDNVTVTKGCLICPFKELSESVLEETHVM